MNTSRMSRLASACACVAILFSGAGYAADMYAPAGLKNSPDVVDGMRHGDGVHATLPAGVSGAAMVAQGETMLMYMPMYMNMQGNYIGTDKVSANTILSTRNISGGGPNYLRFVPESMDALVNMVGVTYGVTNAINIMVMGSYVEKDMPMTTYSMPMMSNGMMGASMMGTKALGTETYSTDGFGDVSVVGLFRVYEDGVNHVHINFGLSLPTGSTTEQMNMLSPMGTTMPMRANYGMQLGTGTVDALPGVTYLGRNGLWSWGALYRGRFALDSDQGYHWGDINQLTGWAGYTFYPGVTATARVAGTVQGKIEGANSQIYGAMQGAYPGWYGGERVDLFGGIEIAGHAFGLGHTKLAIEAGFPLYQDLNGPQIGENWQLNAALGILF